MESCDVHDDDRNQVVPVAAKKVDEFYFVKIYQDEDLKKGLEEAMIVRQRQFDDQIRDIQRELFKKECLERHRSNGGPTSIHCRIEWRLTYYYRKKSSLEDELRSLRETLKRMSISSSKTPKDRKDSVGHETEFVPRKSHYRTLQHCANNRVEEKEMIKKFKQRFEEERIVEEERISAQKKDDYHYRGYKPEPEPEPSYSVKELRAEIKFQEMEIEKLRICDNRERAEIRREALNLANTKKDVALLEKEMIVLADQKAEHDAFFFQIQRHNEEMRSAEKLAEGKNVKAVKELSHAIVDKFMAEWNNDSKFRKDYVRRNLASLERRQLTKDGLSQTSKNCFYAEKHNQQNL